MFLVLSMVNVSVYVFDSWPNYHVSSKTLSWNYHSPHWHLLLRRELISYRISLLLDPAHKLHLTPTDVSGFKTVGTLWTVFLNLPGVNATIVEKLEMFVRLWTKLWMNATVIYCFYGPFFFKKTADETTEKTISKSSTVGVLPVQALCYLHMYHSTWRNS